MLARSLEEYESLKKELLKKFKGDLGCVVEFKGVVRNYDLVNNEKIPSQKFFAPKKTSEEVLRLSEKYKSTSSVIEVLVYHGTGELQIGEVITAISVFASHRKEAFEVLEALVNDVKRLHSNTCS